MKRNEVVLDGRLLKRGALRYTPAGTPAIDFLIGHRSLQSEAGGERKASCEIEAVALGDMAIKLNTLKLNRPVRVRGFLAQRSVGNRKLLLHVLGVEAMSDSDQA